MSDANYDKDAEVHVPGYCSTMKSDYKKGCLFPGALNFDPYAKQSGKCHYILHGCTSSTSLNYNSEASKSDGSCIEPVLGCTLAAKMYDGVASDTPAHESIFYGSALRGAGKIGLSDNAVVKKSDVGTNANVLANCVLAIEGCMDSTAVNYDSYATVNTGTWCIMEKKGCMMPAEDAVSSKWNTMAERTHEYDGLTLNYDPAVTVHVKTSCYTSVTTNGETIHKLKRLGCMSADALNYDKYATVNTTCYFAYNKGCLHPEALNFNCTTNGFDKCDSAAKWPALRIAFHDSALCTFYKPPPPPPPPSASPNPPNMKATEVSNTEVTGSFVLQGDLSTVEGAQGDIQKGIADQSTADVSDVEVGMTAASVIVTFKIKAADA